jgi:hypothetical protein
MVVRRTRRDAGLLPDAVALLEPIEPDRFVGFLREHEAVAVPWSGGTDSREGGS